MASQGLQYALIGPSVDQLRLHVTALDAGSRADALEARFVLVRDRDAVVTGSGQELCDRGADLAAAHYHCALHDFVPCWSGESRALSRRLEHGEATGLATRPGETQDIPANRREKRVARRRCQADRSAARQCARADCVPRPQAWTCTLDGAGAHRTART